MFLYVVRSLQVNVSVIERSWHLGGFGFCFPLRLSVCCVTVVCVVNVSICHEISHRNECRERDFMATNDERKKHVWYLLMFERYIRLHTKVKMPVA